MNNKKIVQYGLAAALLYWLYSKWGAGGGDTFNLGPGGTDLPIPNGTESNEEAEAYIKKALRTIRKYAPPAANKAGWEKALSPPFVNAVYPITVTPENFEQQLLTTFNRPSDLARIMNVLKNEGGLTPRAQELIEQIPFTIYAPRPN